VYAGTARYTEAEELLRRALPILERTLGEEHPLTLSGTIDYAGLLAEVGRIPEAIVLLEQLATRNLQNLETRGHVSLHCTAAPVHSLPATSTKPPLNSTPSRPWIPI